MAVWEREGRDLYLAEQLGRLGLIRGDCRELGVS